jgi:hypothetical protein
MNKVWVKNVMWEAKNQLIWVGMVKTNLESISATDRFSQKSTARIKFTYSL